MKCIERILASFVYFLLAMSGPFSVSVAAATFPPFKAAGEVHNVLDGEAQRLHVTMAFHDGRMRVETDSQDTGRAIFVAAKGDDTIAMLDPKQKIVVRMNSSAFNGGGSTDLPSFHTMLDPAGFRSLLEKEGKKIGPGQNILGHRTTVWERIKSGNTIKVWFAESLKLPLRIAGRNAKGDEFNLQITSLDLHPTFGKYDFMAVPPGYTEIVTETVGNE